MASEAGASRQAERFGQWYQQRRAGGRDVTVTLAGSPAGGFSNELLFVSVGAVGDGVREHLAVRLAPSGRPLFPEYDLEMQVVVQQEAGSAGVPVAHPIIMETDPTWLGQPFLVMPQVEGRHPGDVPTNAEWLMALPADHQRQVHRGFLDMLADIHRMPFRDGPLPGVLRGSDDLVDELTWWERFTEWACDGVDPTAPLELFGWCRAHLPSHDGPTSVLWGDVRLGNVVIGDDLRPAAVLDWEMASLGPAELDLGWFSSLSTMTERFSGRRVPGFLGRDEIIAHHQRRLGRQLQDMEWHEAFALARSAALSVRAAIVATPGGERPPEPASHPVVRYTRRFIEELG